MAMMVNGNSDTLQNIGKYRVQRLLGRGSYSRVYLALHPQLQAKRALKLLDPEVSRESGLEEAVLQARLEHPNIIQMYDVGRHDNCLFMVAEYAPGGSLAELLDKGALPYDTAAGIAGQVLSALVHAHGRGVVHRDLKPDNILFGQEQTVKVADFGLASLLDNSGGGTGPVAGSAGYMAPEQFQGQWSAASDLWAMGCLLVHMLGGRVPFDSNDEFQAVSQARRGPAEVLHRLSRVAPQALLDVIARLLEPLPENRPNSAEDTQRMLDQAMAEIKAKGSLKTVHMPTMEADDWSVFRGGIERSGSVYGDLGGDLSEAWQYNAGAAVHGSPAVSRGAVFFGDNDGWLTALDLLSGRLMWRWQGPSTCFAQPVAAAGAVAAVWQDGTVCAFDADSGNVLWQTKPGGEIWAGPQITDSGLAVACQDGKGLILDARDGATLRQWDLEQPMEAEPLLLAGKLIWAGFEGLLLAVDPVSGGELWRKKLDGALESAPAGLGLKVYLTILQGRLICLDAQDGTIIWKTRLDRMLASGLAVGEQSLGLASIQGDVWLVDASNGSTIWQVRLPEAVTAPVAITARCMVVCGRRGKIYLLDLKDGVVRQRLDIQGSFDAGPAVWRRMLVTVDTGGLARLWRSGGEAIGDDL